MLTARELSYGIFGAWRLARFDADAMRYFDTSVDGFWKSFYAAAIALPAFIIMTAFSLAKAELPEHVGFLEVAVVEASGYVMSWVAFPLLMTVVSDVLQRGERYLGYIVALNWAQLLIVAVQLPAFLFVVASGTEPGQPHPVTLIVLFIVSFYLWFVTKAALQINGWAAGGVVIILFTVNSAIEIGCLLLLR